MNDYVVWMDSKNARIFALKSSGIEKSHLKKSGKEHQSRHKHDMKTDANSEHYYRDLAARLKGADQLLLIGPGLAKKDFQAHLTTHQANTLAKKIIGLDDFQSFEHKTEKQMMAQAKKFFKEYDKFDSL
jgi:stalled ribosome rescue protein Dom34